MKKAFLILSATIITAAILTAWAGISKIPQAIGTFKEVKIGTQVWMAENLTVDKFRNGDPIPEAKTDEDWTKGPVWCYYGNDPANGAKYGKLYNWKAVNDPRGLAPAGWHIPSDAEWTHLTDFLGGTQVAGTKMKSAGGRFNSGPGANESGFSGLPGGCRRSSTFDLIGAQGGWWSSTEEDEYSVWTRTIYFLNGTVYRSGHFKEYGHYVRCIRD